MLEDANAYRLSGKTGTGMAGTSYVGWFVGYLEEEITSTFCRQPERTHARGEGAAAREITLEILQGSSVAIAGKPARQDE